MGGIIISKPENDHNKDASLDPSGEDPPDEDDYIGCDQGRNHGTWLIS